MTYFSFLIRFVGVPLLVLAFLTLWDIRRGRWLPEPLRGMPTWVTILAHVAAAVVWTTPWDNYLIATGVWFYNPDLVTGITLGRVPIEEYTFFVVQTLLTGLWVLWLARRLKPAPLPIQPATGGHRSRLRMVSAAVVGLIVVAAWAFFFFGPASATYLAISLGWLLIPVIPQLLAGANVLWHNRRLVLHGWLPPWLYLSAVDSLAISAGTWTIDPNQSTGVMLGGVLPIEEFIFFGLTNMLIVFGMVLFLATDNVAVKRWSRRMFASRSGEPQLAGGVRAS